MVCFIKPGTNIHLELNSVVCMDAVLNLICCSNFIWITGQLNDICQCYPYQSWIILCRKVKLNNPSDVCIKKVYVVLMIEALNAMFELCSALLNLISVQMSRAVANYS